jgi:hypothetical protein
MAEFLDARFRQLRAEALRDARRLSGGEHAWLVYELEQYDRRGRTLVFESDSIVRRIRNYPANWRDLSDEDLDALSSRI